ncbi:AP-3 complex subunit delta [Verticillium alfalfae VaMs.102]|uniref:AP-3 complex subunit delta n=1 Tax=Verticillium alfalfae (strain VaMs.102 / ATCC MYA-4576 / FGSC 10136) TaxID=526221 RepID=C9SG65_VERA1|nr:AP-3 complex subunit delta [Verticillium alfalfae VaMs.102]EEY18079.1 AP-3 complex subunit delta [Verticillium alfalfae VaMs.102]
MYEPLNPMFEKSLYDLIRGLRNHKGNEREYIQNSLKECRAEVRSQDMDLKATALMKLVYLEMVGHDMSWASFHVLEVMSSPKYHQKRVGYLAAVQSFRPDTEVLMLATNLLKKDLASPHATTITLPMATLPHIITPSLALSTISDLLPRLSHSHPNIRKKVIVTLYRLALVYPETLRAAWPKIKERLMNKDEDPSVTAAIVNVVCELGWRRPHDFLPLAPRLFELLVEGGNNWMAIKLIKLFATLTPLEPRLVRKLLPPLTDLIRTTPAMSLLYECINGIIQGGILGSADDGSEEIATLCVNKLRGMIMVDGDPNLKYVALLAFNKIVLTHPFLVAQQEDVILECIDSPDITIRIKALDLVKGMVSGDNLVSVVSRLMKQLRSSTPPKNRQNAGAPLGPDSAPDSEEEAEVINPNAKEKGQAPPLPDDYRIDVIGRILDMCAQNNYANLVDFDWYIDVLTQLVRMAPAPRPVGTELESASSYGSSTSGDISEKIGDELRNVSVKVMAMRRSVVMAADLILTQLNADTPPGHFITSASIKSIAWIVGEYPIMLSSTDDSLTTLLQTIPRTNIPEILITCLQAVAKVFAFIASNDRQLWTPEWKSRITLLMARVINIFEPLALHPSLEVQERAVEFIELLKLTAEAASGHDISTEEAEQDPPLLLTQAIPSLFQGWELNSVAPGAQPRTTPSTLAALAPAPAPVPVAPRHPFTTFFRRKTARTSILTRSPSCNWTSTSSAPLRRRPLPLSSSITFSSKGHRRGPASASSSPQTRRSQGTAAGATSGLSTPRAYESENNSDSFTRSRAKKLRQGLLHVDSSHIGTFSLEGDNDAARAGGAGAGAQANPYDYERQQREEAEMAQAMKEVERLRLEMQRANERISVAQGVDAEGTVVKRKVKKKSSAATGDGTAVKKTTKKKKKVEGGETLIEGDAATGAVDGNGEPAVVVAKKKKKKKAPVVITDDAEAQTGERS